MRSLRHHLSVVNSSHLIASAMRHACSPTWGSSSHSNWLHNQPQLARMLQQGKTTLMWVHQRNTGLNYTCAFLCSTPGNLLDIAFPWSVDCLLVVWVPHWIDTTSKRSWPMAGNGMPRCHLHWLKLEHLIIVNNNSSAALELLLGNNLTSASRMIKEQWS